ncbi:MAG: AMP-binding protein [Burkholderiaceae bacterium]|jgi:acyl-CoA synthetase (AMP-forming)/AMP-acid ligase II|nr:AMP-binding protein [Burkholderiaceae bacterium]
MHIDAMNYDPTPLEINLIERVCVGDIIARSADLFPQSVAVTDGKRRITYEAFNRQIDRLGHALLTLGLAHQDVVSVMTRNVLELLVSYFACARAGLTCAPVNLALSPAEIAWCLADSKTRVLIAEQALADVAEQVLSTPLPDLKHQFWIGKTGNPDSFEALLAHGHDAPLEALVKDRDSVQLLYTSGTTAQPKGVLTSHLAVTMAALSGALVMQATPGYTVLAQLPLFHCAMLNSIVIPALLAGGRAVLAKGFEPHAIADLIEQEAIDLVLLLPMMHGQMIDDPVLGQRTFPTVKRAMYAMAPMSEQRLHQVHAMFPNADVVLGSGQTEFTPASCVQRPEHQWTKAATWGTATVMTRAAVMDEAGRLLPRGQTGELVYRGPQVMNSYLNQPQASRNCLRHGWFHSGDVVHIDDDGAIWFQDRTKDLIKTGGENVASIEIERCLLGYPDVLDAAVVGVPHPHWGEAVTAVVTSKPGSQIDEAELMAFCRGKLAPFKIPKRIIVKSEMPRTGTGKIQKHLLRSELAQLFTPSRSDTD